MSTSTVYITQSEFRDYIKSKSSTDSDDFLEAISSASRAVDAYCGRFFYTVDGSQLVSPDMNDPAALWILQVDDIASQEGLVVSTGSGDGTYGTPLVYGTEFIGEPVNRQRAGITGWPITSLRALGGARWPIRTSPTLQDTVLIEATFGWLDVPAPVKRATKILAGQFYKLGDALLGVAGWGAYGDIKVREIPQAAALLDPYRAANVWGIG